MRCEIAATLGIDSSPADSRQRVITSRFFYSNQATPTPPQPVRTAAPGSVTVREVVASTGVGPQHVVRLTLRPLGVQILRNAG